MIAGSIAPYRIQCCCAWAFAASDGPADEPPAGQPLANWAAGQLHPLDRSRFARVWHLDQNVQETTKANPLPAYGKDRLFMSLALTSKP